MYFPSSKNSFYRVILRDEVESNGRPNDKPITSIWTKETNTSLVDVFLKIKFSRSIQATSFYKQINTNSTWLIHHTTVQNNIIPHTNNTHTSHHTTHAMAKIVDKIRMILLQLKDSRRSADEMVRVTSYYHVQQGDSQVLTSNAIRTVNCSGLHVDEVHHQMTRNNNPALTPYTLQLTPCQLACPPHKPSNLTL